MNNNFLKNFTCVYFVLKKAKPIWNSSADYQRKEIYRLDGLQNFLKEFNPAYFVLKTKAKETENSSADCQKKEIICSTAFENN